MEPHHKLQCIACLEHTGSVRMENVCQPQIHGRLHRGPVFVLSDGDVLTRPPLDCARSVTACVMRAPTSTPSMGGMWDCSQHVTDVTMVIEDARATDREGIHELVTDIDCLPLRRYLYGIKLSWTQALKVNHWSPLQLLSLALPFFQFSQVGFLWRHAVWRDRSNPLRVCDAWWWEERERERERGAAWLWNTRTILACWEQGGGAEGRGRLGRQHKQLMFIVQIKCCRSSRGESTGIRNPGLYS